MLAATIHSMEIALLSLLALFIYRINSLASSSSSSTSPNSTKAAVDDTPAQPAEQSYQPDVTSSPSVNHTPQATPTTHASEVEDELSDDDFIYIDENAPLSPYERKMESLKQAQIFAANQLLTIKREFGNLQKTELHWLREAISLYLIGAIDLISQQAECDNRSRKELIRLVLRSNLSLSQDDISKYLRAAVRRTPKADEDQMVRCGAMAAKAWRESEHVPVPLTLRAQLDQWGIIA